MFKWSAVLLMVLCPVLISACSRAPEGAVAPVNVSKRVMPADEATKSLYLQSCYGCHSSGAGGAPRTANVDDWQPRLEQGMDTLLEHTIKGFKAMPPKGMCMNCGEAELVALIRFMSGQE